MKELLLILTILSVSCATTKKSPSKPVAKQEVRVAHDSILNTLRAHGQLKEWQYNSSKFTWKLVDTMYLEPWCCGPMITWRDTTHLDSFEFSIRLESNWDSARIKNQIELNMQIITPLSEKFLRYKDRQKVKGKWSRDGFLAYPYQDLRNAQYKSGTHDIMDVVRIPDALIGNTGLFLDNPQHIFAYVYIYQKRPRDKAFKQLEFISKKILNIDYVCKGRFRYR